MAKTGLQIAEELRAESMRLSRESNHLQTIAQIIEGVHYSLPRRLLASDEERLARLTPEQRAEFDRRTAEWERRHKR